MAAFKCHGSRDRYDCDDGIRLDRTGIARHMAPSRDRMANCDRDNPYRKPVCDGTDTGRLRDRSGHLVLSSIWDDIRCDDQSTARWQQEFEALVTALGPFENPQHLRALLRHFGSLHALRDAGEAAIAGRLCNRNDAAKINALIDLADMLAKPASIDHPVIGDCASLIVYLQNGMGGCRVETFRVLFLNTHNRMIADEVMWTGTVSEVQIYPREVMRRALELDSSAFIAAHNHPSNAVQPSQSDIVMTHKLLDASHALNIAFHDHIIVSRSAFHSMRVHKSIDPWI